MSSSHFGSSSRVKSQPELIVWSVGSGKAAAEPNCFASGLSPLPLRSLMAAAGSEACAVARHIGTPAGPAPGTPLGAKRPVRRRTDGHSPLQEMDGMESAAVAEGGVDVDVRRNILKEVEGNDDIPGAIKELTTQIRDLRVNTVTKADIQDLQGRIVEETKHFVHNEIAKAVDPMENEINEVQRRLAEAESVQAFMKELKQEFAKKVNSGTSLPASPALSTRETTIIFRWSKCLMTSDAS